MEPGFEEPREAWPLELEASGRVACVEVRGPAGRGAVLRDVSLRTAPGDPPRSVLLQGVQIRGRASLDGEGCALDDCEACCGIEVAPDGAALIRGCLVSSSRIGIEVRGPAVCENNSIRGCPIGICLHDNPAAVLRGNRFAGFAGYDGASTADSSSEDDVAPRAAARRAPVAAAIVLHVSLDAEAGSRVELRPSIDEACAGAVEVSVNVPGVVPLAFHEWPLPTGLHSAYGARGARVDIGSEASGSVLHVVDTHLPASRPGKPKKRRAAASLPPPSAAEATAEPPRLVSGPGWARAVLGLRLDGTPLSLEQVRRAYRQRAREVHPDKQAKAPPGAPGTDEASPAGFHKVTAAYEAMVASLQAPAAAARMDPGRRQGRRRA